MKQNQLLQKFRAYQVKSKFICFLLHHVVDLLHHVVDLLHHVVDLLHHVVDLLHHVVDLLNQVVDLLHHVVDLRHLPSSLINIIVANNVYFVLVKLSSKQNNL